MPRLLILGLAALTATLAAPAGAPAQTREALIVFKDGFTVKGNLIQKRDFIVDPASGRSFIIPANGSFMHLDDDIRRIHFSPNQVHEAFPSKPGETRRDLIQVVKQKPSVRAKIILPNWTFEKASPWDDRWERVIHVNTQRGHIEIIQRIIKLTPWHTYIMTLDYSWDPQFRTKELGPDFVLGLLHKHYKTVKGKTEPEKKFEIAKFMFQAGWYGHSLQELERLVKEHPEDKAAAEAMIKQLQELRSTLFVEDIERTHRIGQHDEARTRIEGFYREKLVDNAGEKQKLVVQDLKNKYEAAKEKIEQAERYLKDLPTRLDVAVRPFWAIAAATIREELTIDTVARLDTFLTFAQQHLRELEANRKLAQTTEQVLAIAVSGWLQGNSLAEPEVKNATKLFRARLMLQEYLKTGDSFGREKVLNAFGKEHDVSPEVMARIIRTMPPALPPDKIDPKEPLRLEIDSFESTGGTYLVQVPPDYSPYRPYPVLMALHTSREKPDGMVARLRDLAAYHGYIIVAPLWSSQGKKQTTYSYSAREHALALDTLRDVRRRFNVDSDRVFLFGWEDGATMAFDIGLSHPHEFAGVLPMNGSAAKFAERYWSNAQYLPFYVVDGDNNGGTVVAARQITQKWVRGHYPSIYVEYKGRASEWYGEELVAMAEWMNKKKRQHPVRELGKYHTAGGMGEEFRTLRETDNKFYWLATDDIDAKYLIEAANWQKTTRPATLQGNIATGNESGVKEARIWNQITLRTLGIKQLTVWLAPNMVDFTKPIVVRVNGAQFGQSRIHTPSLSTLLEEFYYSGDRQRLYYAKIELKL